MENLDKVELRFSDVKKRIVALKQELLFSSLKFEIPQKAFRGCSGFSKKFFEV